MKQHQDFLKDLPGAVVIVAAAVLAAWNVLPDRPPVVALLVAGLAFLGGLWLAQNYHENSQR